MIKIILDLKEDSLNEFQSTSYFSIFLTLSLKIGINIG